MSARFVLGLQFLWLIPLYLHADSQSILPNSPNSLSGIYQVTRATLNTRDCEQAGKTAEYASRYLQLSELGENKAYRIEICNGESLDEIECVEGSRGTKLTDTDGKSWQGYRYYAQHSLSKKGVPQCLLHADRRRVTPLSASSIKYERSDWSEILSDYVAECSRETAKAFSNYQSLKCNTHIVLFATKIQ